VVAQGRIELSELGLFPLGLVLLPGERVPLHIFEPRYRELLGECLEHEQEFGLVFTDDDGMRTIGTHAAVTSVLERFDDGRLNVVVEGRARFRIARLTSGRSFQTAQVESFPDVPDPPRKAESERALRLFRELRELVGSDVDEPEPDEESLAFAVAVRVDFGAPAKQRLLELTSERDRLRLVQRLLEHAAQKFEAERARLEAGQRNGRPAPPG